MVTPRRRHRPMVGTTNFIFLRRNWKFVTTIIVVTLVIRQVGYNPNLLTFPPSSSTNLHITPPPRRRRYGNPNATNIPDHPHAGAKDEFGHYGYVHDPTILRNTFWSNYSTFVVSPDEVHDLCVPIGEGPEAMDKDPSVSRGVFDKIQIANESSSSLAAPFSSIKVFCAVYTHPGSINQSNAIAQTWGKRCDGYMAASTETNHDAGTIHLPHYGNNEGKYDGIWQKVRSILGYIYNNFLEEYDYYFLCGDDTYLIIENLKVWLLTNPTTIHNTTYVAAGAWSHAHPVMMNWYNVSTDWVYLGGGSGYVLGRSTVKALVERVFPFCYNELDAAWEDFMISLCLQDYLNVTFLDTRDETEADRFIQFDPVNRASGDGDQTGGLANRLYTNFNWTERHGLDAVSSSAISFHMIKPPVKMRRYDRLLYRRHDPILNEADCGSYIRTNGNHS